MAKEKYNHNEADFMAALNMSKDEIFDIASDGLEDHLVRNLSISECIVKMVKSMKSNAAEDIKMFVAGMMFSQILQISKKKGGDIEKHMKQLDRIEQMERFEHESPKRIGKLNLPFTSKDLLKSVRDEMESKSQKAPKDTDSK